MSKKKRHFHRNAGPKKIRNRVYREMYRDPELLQSDKEGLLIDEYWNPYNPYNPFPKSDKYSMEYLIAEEYGPFWDIDEGDFDTEHDAHLFKIMDDIFWSVSKKPLLNEKLIDKVDVSKIIENFESQKGEQKISIRYLREFLNNIHSHFYRRNHLVDYITESAGHPLNILSLKEISNERENPDIWKLLLLFSPFWIRSPLSWSKESDISLVEHLFVRYRAPGYLYHVWEKTSRIDFNWLTWFLIIAQGGSMKKASREFDWKFSSKNLQYLFDADAGMTPVEAYIYAEIKRMSGSERVVNLILDSPSFVIDLTNPTTSEDFLQFWRSTVEWLIQHESELTDVQANHVLDWAMHEFTESDMEGDRHFSWRGRMLARILERSAEYQQMIYQPRQGFDFCENLRPLSWDKNQLDWACEDETGNEWTFIELNNSKKLFEEGKELSHCVGSYYSRCVAGNSAIVSLRRKGKRRITLEISPGKKILIQACGKRNRQPDEEEMKVINLWFKEVVNK